VTLTAASTHDDPVQVEQGTLRIRHGGALGATVTAGGVVVGTTVNAGATLAFDGGIAVGNETVTISGAGAGGAGALRSESGNNSLAGPVTLAAAATP